VERSVNTFFLASALWCTGALRFVEDSYFPIKQKSGAESVKELEAKWYGESLKRMKEPRLPSLAKDVGVDVYRTTILPTWGNSIAVRVQKRGMSYSLSARRLGGQAGYDPGQLVETKDIDLNAVDSNTLRTLIQDLGFFDMPSNDEVRGFDGDEWILEGVSGGKYHLVHRWCATSYNPEKRKLTAFLALCKFLVDKSALSQRPANKGHTLI
jgi:hypothetical protein